jgi:type IV secretion system protein VirB10
MWPAWQAQDIKYPAVAPEPPHTPPPPRDLNAEKIALLQKELADHRAALEALKRQPAKPPAPVPPAPPKPKRHSGVDLTPAQPKAAEAAAGLPSVSTYTLAPGATKIACQIETAMHSEIPAVFTARVKTAVYDTATGQQLLIPQGSTLLGKYDSGELLYGNERIPTWGLTLALPNGHSVEVGNAPVMDQVGMMGLTGHVDHHYWRSLAAVLIAGTLRGGSMALQASIAQSAGVGQVATGIAAAGSQYGQQAAGRAIDVRPTITVEAGQPCTVILTKALELPAYQVR